MPASGQTSEAEWNRYKAIIEEEYLHQNRPALEVQKHLKAMYGFDTTVRKLKLKFEAWGWDKKIPAGHYHIMARIIQDIGQHVTFIVPKMGGRQAWRVDGKKALKEWNRKRSNNEKTGKPPPPTLELDVAYRMMRDAGITVQRNRPGHSQQQQLAASGSHNQQDWQVSPTQPSNVHTLPSDEDGDDDDEDESVASDMLLDEPGLITDSSRELNLQNFPPHSRVTQNIDDAGTAESLEQPCPTDIIPFQAAFLADLHCNIFPQKPEYRFANPSIAIAHHSEEHPFVTLDSASNTWDFSDHFGLHSTPGPFHSQRGVSEKLIAEQLTQYYRDRDPGFHRKQVLEFSAYYIGEVLAGHETLHEYRHPHREKARNQLRVMLDRGNMELLTHCYWLVDVICSYDKPRLLLALFEDCVDCIETSQSYLAVVLQPWIRLMVLHHRDLQNDYRTESERLQPASLDHLKRAFNASQELQKSIEYLKQHGDTESPTWLILCISQAWESCRSKRPTGHSDMVNCLEKAEAIFGPNHLVTINCMKMVSQTYENDKNLDMATINLDLALIHLKPCSRMLQLTYFKLLLRRARLFIAKGELHEALVRLEQTFEFRLQHLGPQAPLTWDVAEELFTTMERQGFAVEAQQRRADLTARFNEEWRKRPMNYPFRQPQRQ